MVSESLEGETPDFLVWIKSLLSIRYMPALIHLKNVKSSSSLPREEVPTFIQSKNTLSAKEILSQSSRSLIP
jgi:hypothetical protein